MSEAALPAVLSLLGVLGTVAVGYLTAAQARTRADLARLTRENRALWYYIRHLIDWGYRPHEQGERPPDPPEPIRHLFEFGEPK